jgi:formylmethanofuran dehydrogenase subunit E-like metal-binding protein
MRTKAFLIIGLVAAVFALAASQALAGSLAADDQILSQGEKALKAAMAELKVQPGQDGLLALTNAGYSEIQGSSTEAFLDLINRATGLSQGTRSLLMVHSPPQTPLWMALFKKEDGRLAFMKWTPEGFKAQSFDASAEKVLTPEGWRAVASGLMGSSTFGIISISHAWASGASWPLLWAGCFHNHLCPGLNSGYVAVEYLKKNLPLGPGDRYVLVGAPPICAMDAFLVLLDTTMGKAGAYALPLKGQDAAKYVGSKAGPLAIAMRVNAKADKCTGMVLGLDWARVKQDTGGADLAPEGGRANPLFWIARVQMSVQMAAMPMEKKLGYIIKVKEFSGPAALANQVAVGNGDPYAVVWAQ